MDYVHIECLLNIIHQSMGLPQIRPIYDAAMKELQEISDEEKARVVKEAAQAKAVPAKPAAPTADVPDYSKPTTAPIERKI